MAEKYKKLNWGGSTASSVKWVTNDGSEEEDVYPRIVKWGSNVVFARSADVDNSTKPGILVYSHNLTSYVVPTTATRGGYYFAGDKVEVTPINDTYWTIDPASKTFDINDSISLTQDSYTTVTFSDAFAASRVPYESVDILLDAPARSYGVDWPMLDDILLTVQYLSTTNGNVATSTVGIDVIKVSDWNALPYPGTVGKYYQTLDDGLYYKWANKMYQGWSDPAVCFIQPTDVWLKTGSNFTVNCALDSNYCTYTYSISTADTVATVEATVILAQRDLVITRKNLNWFGDIEFNYNQVTSEVNGLPHHIYGLSQTISGSSSTPTYTYTDFFAGSTSLNTYTVNIASWVPGAYINIDTASDIPSGMTPAYVTTTITGKDRQLSVIYTDTLNVLSSVDIQYIDYTTADTVDETLTSGTTRQIWQGSPVTYAVNLSSNYYTCNITETNNIASPNNVVLSFKTTEQTRNVNYTLYPNVTKLSWTAISQHTVSKTSAGTATVTDTGIAKAPYTYTFSAVVNTYYKSSLSLTSFQPGLTDVDVKCWAIPQTRTLTIEKKGARNWVDDITVEYNKVTNANTTYAAVSATTVHPQCQASSESDTVYDTKYTDLFQGSDVNLTTTLISYACADYVNLSITSLYSTDSVNDCYFTINCTGKEKTIDFGIGGTWGGYEDGVAVVYHNPANGALVAETYTANASFVIWQGDALTFTPNTPQYFTYTTTEVNLTPSTATTGQLTVIFEPNKRQLTYANNSQGGISYFQYAWTDARGSFTQNLTIATTKQIFQPFTYNFSVVALNDYWDVTLDTYTAAPGDDDLTVTATASRKPRNLTVSWPKHVSAITAHYVRTSDGRGVDMLPTVATNTSGSIAYTDVWQGMDLSVTADPENHYTVTNIAQSNWATATADASATIYVQPRPRDLNIDLGDDNVSSLFGSIGVSFVTTGNVSSVSGDYWTTPVSQAYTNIWTGAPVTVTAAFASSVADTTYYTISISGSHLDATYDNASATVTFKRKLRKLTGILYSGISRYLRDGDELSIQYLDKDATPQTLIVNDGFQYAIGSTENVWAGTTTFTVSTSVACHYYTTVLSYSGSVPGTSTYTVSAYIIPETRNLIVEKTGATGWIGSITATYQKVNNKGTTAATLATTTVYPQCQPTSQSDTKYDTTYDDLYRGSGVELTVSLAANVPATYVNFSVQSLYSTSNVDDCYFTINCTGLTRNLAITYRPNGALEKVRIVYYDPYTGKLLTSDYTESTNITVWQGDSLNYSVFKNSDYWSYTATPTNFSASSADASLIINGIPKQRTLNYHGQASGIDDFYWSHVDYTGETITSSTSAVTASKTIYQPYTYNLSVTAFDYWTATVTPTVVEPGSTDVEVTATASRKPRNLDVSWSDNVSTLQIKYITATDPVSGGTTVTVFPLTTAGVGGSKTYTDVWQASDVTLSTVTVRSYYDLTLTSANLAGKTTATASIVATATPQTKNLNVIINNRDGAAGWITVTYGAGYGDSPSSSVSVSSSTTYTTATWPIWKGRTVTYEYGIEDSDTYDYWAPVVANLNAGTITAGRISWDIYGRSKRQYLSVWPAGFPSWSYTGAGYSGSTSLLVVAANSPLEYSGIGSRTCSIVGYSMSNTYTYSISCTINGAVVKALSATPNRAPTVSYNTTFTAYFCRDTKISWRNYSDRVYYGISTITFNYYATSGCLTNSSSTAITKTKGYKYITVNGVASTTVKFYVKPYWKATFYTNGGGSVATYTGATTVTYTHTGYYDDYTYIIEANRYATTNMSYNDGWRCSYADARISSDGYNVTVDATFVNDCTIGINIQWYIAADTSDGSYWESGVQTVTVSAGSSKDATMSWYDDASSVASIAVYAKWSGSSNWTCIYEY